MRSLPRRLTQHDAQLGWTFAYTSSLLIKGLSMSTTTFSRIDYVDEELRDCVVRFLSSLHFPSFRELQVDVSNGHVTLSGELNSYYEKQVALKLCKHVAGVLGIIDEIVVKEGNEKTTPVTAK